jgi:hypothetical protein
MRGMKSDGAKVKGMDLFIVWEMCWHDVRAAPKARANGKPGWR